MTKLEIRLFTRLLKAARSGECPDTNCPICEEKWLAINSAAAYLNKQVPL